MSTSARRASFAAIAVLASAATAWPCEIVVVGSGSAGLPGLVRAAQVIVRAKADRVGDRLSRQGLFSLPTQVRFRVVAVYKGALDSDVIEFNGVLGTARPDDRPVAYNFDKPRSFTPNCFNPGYLQGAEYLLLLGPDDGIYSQAGDLTPYWAPQQPTNERIIGDDDPWLLWVIRSLGPNPPSNVR